MIREIAEDERYRELCGCVERAKINLGDAQEALAAFIDARLRSYGIHEGGYATRQAGNETLVMKIKNVRVDFVAEQRGYLLAVSGRKVVDYRAGKVCLGSTLHWREANGIQGVLKDNLAEFF